MTINGRASAIPHYRRRLQRLGKIIRDSAAQSGPLNLRRIATDVLHETNLGQTLVGRFAPGVAAGRTREYVTALPDGFSARQVRVRLSVPNVRTSSLAGFSDHLLDASGAATDTVIATMIGAFAISHDLGSTWQTVRIRSGRFRRHRLLHMKHIGGGEFLVQAEAERWHPGAPRKIDNLVVDVKGNVLTAQQMNGSHWHGPRSVDIADGTLMYAEYPYEDPDAGVEERASSRVLRSRDSGRTWEVVLEFQGHQVRHFHFLQARPGVPREWWLTSGDHPLESRIWVSRDDGDSWEDLTREFGEKVPIAGLEFPRTIFRLTDLAWEQNDIVWGTDDFLARNQFPMPGARVFRSPNGKLAPAVVGKAKWPIRNIVDAGEYYFVLTQGCFQADAPAAEKMPGVYLMRKSGDSSPGLVHLFDVDIHSRGRTGFTYSRASRAARNGTFFTYRGSTDAFPYGHKILRWDVSFS
ncbi:MAG TPA: hypothetical protein VHU18_05205 [Rhizomicrobium sp.]|nr:hypothetical protein [Rhizomicrobium sp.]